MLFVLHLRRKPSLVRFNKHHNQYNSPQICLNPQTPGGICGYEPQPILNHKEKKKKSPRGSRVHTHTHTRTYSVSAGTLKTGHGRNVEDWNVWYDLQPKCQCCTVASREGEGGGTRRDRGVKWNLNVFVNHRENPVCAREREGEREGEKEDDRERARERRAAARVFVLYRD